MINLHDIGGSNYDKLKSLRYQSPSKTLFNQTEYWLDARKELIPLSTIDQRYATNIVNYLRARHKTWSTIIRLKNETTLDGTYDILETPLFKALEAKL